MLTKTDYSVPFILLENLILQSNEFKSTINQPTGRFFYDPWELKPEFKNTVWEYIYNSLPVDKGEARIINLDQGNCYRTHADIDDRYHLNISGDNCYLIDLDNETLFPIKQDGTWYAMDAGRRHTAANFGKTIRSQLVIRKLLSDTVLIDAVKILVTSKNLKDDSRFLIDNTISPWLNAANKNKIITNFAFDGHYVSFELEKLALASLKEILPDEFNLEISI